jgi:hypothetical protein
VKFADAEPLRLNYGERMRIVLVNDTMMTHPIHLHGMWSDLEDESGNFMVRKHTIDMPPGTKRAAIACAPTRWALGLPLPPALPHGSRHDARSAGGGMNWTTPRWTTPRWTTPRWMMDHSGMDHSGMDHSGMDHSGMDHASMGHQPGVSEDLPPTAEPREPIPVVTPTDRAAAFPDLDEHLMHGESINSYWALDRLEAWDADEDGTGIAWEAKGWVGSDLNRLWLRSEGERAGGSTESADVEVLYGRAIAHGGTQSPVSAMTSVLAAARRAPMPRLASSVLPRTSSKSKPRPTWASPARSDSGRKPNTKCCSPTG